MNPGRRGTAGFTFVVAAVVGACALGEMAFLRRMAEAPMKSAVGVALAPDGRDPVELPGLIGIAWAGRNAPVSPVEREVLPPDTGYSRKLYVAIDRAAPEVFFSIVLSGRDRTSIHRPELCLIGQGWTILDAQTHKFVYERKAPMADVIEGFPATLLRVRREIMTPRGKITRPELVAYWFIGGDAIVASHWERIARDAWNRVRHGRADRWAYVLMQTDASDGEPAALARMQSVLQGTLPRFQLPGVVP